MNFVFSRGKVLATLGKDVYLVCCVMDQIYCMKNKIRKHLFWIIRIFLQISHRISSEQMSRYQWFLLFTYHEFTVIVYVIPRHLYKLITILHWGDFLKGIILRDIVCY